MHEARLILCIGAPSLALLVGLGVFITARRSALWVRCSWLFVAILAVPLGCLCFIRDQHRPSLPFRTRAFLEHYETLVGGVVMGVIITLAIYGLVSVATKKQPKV